jgi:beta propeller repeat protein
VVALVLIVVALVLIVLAMAALPSVASAGHIASRFTVPPPPDPEWKNQGGAQVSQDGVAWRVSGDDMFMMGYVWKIGDAAATERSEFRWGSSFDYANWDTSHVAVYCLNWEEAPDEVWVSNGTLTQKLAGGVNDARNPRISGTMVVWEERVAGSWDIRAAQIDMDTLAPDRTWIVCDAAGDQKSPDADGSVVVWQDKRSGQWDVYIRSLSLGNAKRLTTSPKKQVHPRIYDRWVVWEDYRNAGYGADVYARRAPQVWSAEAGWHWELGAVRQVCHARKNQLQPDVGGGFVVWTDWRNAGPLVDDDPPDTDIRGYEISSRDRFRITTADGMERSPDLEYRTVVYSSYQSTHMGQPWGGRVKGAHLQH